MYDNCIGRCPRKQFAECACPGSVVSTSLSNATGASAPWRFCFPRWGEHVFAPGRYVDRPYTATGNVLWPFLFSNGDYQQ